MTSTLASALETVAALLWIALAVLFWVRIRKLDKRMNKALDDLEQEIREHD